VIVDAALAGSAQTPRPRWSVMIPTYNCAGYLRTTLESVLAQDLGPARMQIEVVDDHSTLDDPREIVQTIGRGRVSFYRQEANVGNVANFNTCIDRATGELIHILHGDDWVRPRFYEALEAAFEHPEVGAAFCRYVATDEHGTREWLSALEQPRAGVIHGWLEKISAGQRLQTPAMTVRREVYERLGGFNPALTGVEDWEMWVRIAAYYPVWYEPEPLAVYRVRSSSLSGGQMKTGENINRLLQAIMFNRRYLPPEKVDQISRVALESCALAAIRRADRAHHAGNRKMASAQLRGAWRASRSWRVAVASTRLVCKAAYREVRLLARS
jgi:glycosyltransferase involved in cell wall biosynthesis